MADNYPRPMNNFFEYTIPKREVAPAGQIYLGTFLAFALFFSFFFGNLLFFLIVLIISIFIFLEKEVEIADEQGNVRVGFYEHGMHFARKDYDYGSMLSYTFSEEIFGDKEEYLRITFKSPAQNDLFIFIPHNVQKREIRDIISKHVKEDTQKDLSFTEQIVLRFF
jgi:hypothetical protein